MEYVVGNRIRCRAEFEDDAGSPIAPTGVSFKFKNPAGTVTAYASGAAQIVNDGVGLYHVDIDADSSGVWFYRFYSTGTGKAADEKSFTVQESEFS